jgi:hypothetical protein
MTMKEETPNGFKLNQKNGGEERSLEMLGLCAPY